MFAREQKAQLIKHGKRLNPDRRPLRGSNRRIVGLLPERKFADADLLVNGKTGIHQQLLSIKANNLSCCLKITSPRLKSRSAILFYNGQAIGCVYGSKKLSRQLFGEEAYEKIISEITRFDNFIDGYILPPQVALAAGSMFHEGLITAQETEKAYDVANRALAEFDSCECAGSIVITDDKNVPQFVMFVSERKLLGTQVLSKGNSSRDKIPEQLSKLWQYLESHPEAKVFASLLNPEQADSLSSENSCSSQPSKSASLESMTAEAFFGGTKITLIREMRRPSIEPVRLNRFVNRNAPPLRTGKQMRLSHNFRGVGGYEVDPR
jgi:hypothetical protein